MSEYGPYEPSSVHRYHARPGAKAHVVYILKDYEGQTLYIGVTSNWLKRLAQHQRRSPWFHFVARVDLDWCSDRATAEANEALLIHQLQPPFNIAHTERGLHACRGEHAECRRGWTRRQIVARDNNR